MSRPPKIAILMPCFNEEQMLQHTFKVMSSYLSGLINQNLIASTSFMAMVDDGSKDNSWVQIKEEAASNGNVELRGISFSRNFGHQNAVFAGLQYFKDQADVIISLDIDLQDDITVIEEMVKKHISGCDIVYGIRKERLTDTFFKKNTALLYYKILQFMNIDIHYNHADYRLTSSKVNSQLEKFNESDLFLRGLFPYLGYTHDFVYYDRKEREYGESKYPFRKMLKLAWIGILSFSSYPLDLVFRLALISLVLSLGLGCYILTSYLKGDVISGWTSISIIIAFFGSVQLLSIGLLSKYISKIFDQTKQRPRFIIQETTND